MCSCDQIFISDRLCLLFLPLKFFQCYESVVGMIRYLFLTGYVYCSSTEIFSSAIRVALELFRHLRNIKENLSWEHILFG